MNYLLNPNEKVCFVQTTRLNVTSVNLDEMMTNAVAMKEDLGNEDAIRPIVARTTMSNIGTTVAVHVPIQAIVG